MGDETLTAPSAQPQKLGFWGKTKLAVKEFFKGVIDAAPRALLFSALAFTGSAVMGNAFGFNPLHVEGFTKEVVLRLMGSVALGSTIAGGIHSFQMVAKADDAPVQNKNPALTPARVASAGATREPEMSFEGVPQMTPMGNRLNPNNRVRA